MTYTPYILGTADLTPTFTTGIFELTATASSTYIEAEVALSAEYVGLGDFCITSFASYTPYTLEIVGTTSVIECTEDLSDFQWNGLSCGLTSPLDFTFIDMNGGLT